MINFGAQFTKEVSWEEFERKVKGRLATNPNYSPLEPSPTPPGEVLTVDALNAFQYVAEQIAINYFDGVEKVDYSQKTKNGPVTLTIEADSERQD